MPQAELVCQFPIRQVLEFPVRLADGDRDALYEALNEAYDGALEYNGVITNVNTLALEEMSDAAAHAILTFAMSTASVSGTAKASPTAGAHVGDRLGSHFRR